MPTDISKAYVWNQAGFGTKKAKSVHKNPSGCFINPPTPWSWEASKVHQVLTA